MAKMVQSSPITTRPRVSKIAILPKHSWPVQSVRWSDPARSITGPVPAAGSEKHGKFPAASLAYGVMAVARIGTSSRPGFRVWHQAQTRGCSFDHFGEARVCEPVFQPEGN